MAVLESTPGNSLPTLRKMNRAAQLSLLLVIGNFIGNSGSIVASDSYPKDWAFHSHPKPIVPAAVHSEIARNELDRFVQAGLAPVQLKPSEEADKRTLLR